MINQTWESIGVEIAKHLMLTLKQSFELDFEVDRARTNHVLHLEVRQPHVVSNFLNSLGILLGRIETQLFAFGASDHHFPCFENQGRRSGGLFHSHDHSRKTFGVVFSISALECNVFQVQLTPQIRSRNEVLEFGRLVLCNLLSLVSLRVRRSRGANQLTSSRLHHRRRGNVVSRLQARLRDQRLLTSNHSVDRTHWHHRRSGSHWWTSRHQTWVFGDLHLLRFGSDILIWPKRWLRGYSRLWNLALPKLHIILWMAWLKIGSILLQVWICGARGCSNLTQF